MTLGALSIIGLVLVFAYICIGLNSEYQDKRLKEKERADSLWIWSETEGKFVIDTSRWYWDKDRTGYYEIATGLPLYLDSRHRK